MAEGYHVPQQSRRDKLRVISQSQTESLGNLQGCTGLVPIYDPSFVSSDLVDCAVNFHCQSVSFGSNAITGVKEEGTNLMGCFGGTNMISSAAASSSPKNHLYVDPQSSVQLNPSTTIQNINGSPFVFTPHTFRVLDPPFHGNEGVGYKPESLSVSTGHEVNSNCAATNGQSLCLSLSSHQTQQSNYLPLELNLLRYDSSMFCNYNKINEGYLLSGINNGDGEGSSSTSLIDQFSRSSIPLGPFTGYASVLKGSRFLKPAQQLLEELSEVGREIYAEKFVPDSSLLDPPVLENLNGNGIADDSLSSSVGGELTSKKSRLLTMLDEVFKRYKLYYQQMQSVIASFESVDGLSSAAPFANLALKSTTKHFKCLKNAITDQLLFTAKSYGKIISEKDETQRLDNSVVKAGTYGQRQFHMTGFVDQPIWRPQRGLPERAVSVLRAWLFEHFLHPYPTDTDKIILAKQTGLSRNQVSNWFINARVRLWKPMVEEIHSLESRHALNKTSQREEEEEAANRLKNSVELENPPFSIPRNGDFPLKRTRNHSMTQNTPRDSEMNWEHDNTLPHNPHLGVGEIHGATGGCVSLTLGLHQNNMGVSDCYSLNPGRRFGLDSHGHGEGCLVSGFIGGQVVLHDFVG